MTFPWRRFIIPEHILKETEAALRSFNNAPEHNEGFVYWAGRCAGPDIIVVATYIPDANTTWGSVEISEAENTRFILWLREHQLVHVAQVHSHPPHILTHSQGDDAWAFMKFPGLVSIVVPNYAARGMRSLDICSVHVFVNDEFQLLTKRQVKDYVIVVPSVDRRR